MAFADYVDFKADIRVFKDRMTAKVLSHPNIKVLLGTCASATAVADAQFDAVICAVGSGPIKPKIKGLAEHADRIFLGKFIYGNETRLGKKTVIIGGGLVGCETAVYLADQGIDTIVVEMLPDVALEASGSHRLGLMGQLRKK